MKIQFLCHSLKETENIATKLAKQIPQDAIICFQGDLGTGKTTFIKEFIHNITLSTKDLITSPTFVYMNVFEGNNRVVYHFDLYRLSCDDEFISAGFYDYLSQGQICCIEWPERISSILEEKMQSCLWISLEHKGQQSRKITLLSQSKKYEKIHF